MQSQAQKLCQDDGIPFEECYRYQYVVSGTPLDLPGFSTIAFDQLSLHVGQDQRHQALEDSNGRKFGYLIGIALTGDGKTFAETLSGNFDASASGAIGQFEAHLAEAAGRFVAIVQLEGRTLFYQDASGMMGGLYNPTLGRVASTLYLCLDSPLKKSPRFFDPETGEKYCEPILHFTPDDRVTRINPSYRFDLVSGQSERFWPRETDQFEHSADDYAAVLDEIISKERNILKALVRLGDVSLSLSGGYDSRGIYACADPETRREFVQIFTHINNKIGWSDAKVAADIAALDGIGIDLFVAPKPRAFGSERARKQTIRRYELASGNLSAPPNEVANGIDTRIARNALVLRGQQIPILKGFAVGRTPTADWTDTYTANRVSQIIDDAQAPETTRTAISDAVKALYRSLPASARCRSVDLLLMEAINGPELAGNFNGFSTAFYLSPFNSRRFVQLFAGFALNDRLSLTAFHHLLLRADARVCGIPVTNQVKRLSLSEDDASVANRFVALRRHRSSYRDATGEPAEDVPIWRFAVGGGSRRLPFRLVRKLISGRSQKHDKSEVSK